MLSKLGYQLLRELKSYFDTQESLGKMYVVDGIIYLDSEEDEQYIKSLPQGDAIAVSRSDMDIWYASLDDAERFAFNDCKIFQEDWVTSNIARAYNAGISEYLHKEAAQAEYGYCPNCTSALIKNPKHAQGIFHCPSCEGTFLILETSKPKK